MMTPISGNAPVAQAPQVNPVPAAVSSNANAAAIVNRATAQDTVTISAAGQQASQAAQDVDHDGDSH
jgi:hypothetical protein